MENPQWLINYNGYSFIVVLCLSALVLLVIVFAQVLHSLLSVSIAMCCCLCSDVDILFSSSIDVQCCLCSGVVIYSGLQMWQSQIENEHFSTLSGIIRLVISLECFIEITPDFLCPFMND